ASWTGSARKLRDTRVGDGNPRSLHAAMRTNDMAEEGKRILVDTSPTKEVVVDGITRDATDEECIFDLIDNSIDAARNIIFRNISPKLRNELPEGYSGYEVKLHIGGASFKISDNCG